ncbi:nucleoside 2-deoxyribosyltransferase [Methylocystis sp. H62]|uniref:PfkB family carbohydrate kinase n=1 Tax=Methylocystis sp. H62 TaxID=2785789 RepID=UPI0018C21506|nr:PfkB family carbohydrate kinase [Methylocystis sp. H62]MBG0794053.1 nucleoside 2-deoxyribosyltransferase [Methylocystis sp. H62]
MKAPLHIVGGVYRERCQWPMPETDNVFGSAGRAAAALQGTGIERILHTYIGPDLQDTIDLILGGFEFQIEKHLRPVDPVFEYVHCLAVPTISPDLVTVPKMAPIHVKGDMVIRFGMLEGDAVVDAGMCVYDPQSAYQPVGFRANGSRARRLALVANSGEAKALTKTADLTVAAERLLTSEHADVVVIKCGLDGAIVASADGVARVPAFAVDVAQTIGSGDVFVAVFAKGWMYDGLAPVDAALVASKVTANYIESSILPVELDQRSRSEIRRATGKVYLAGPFFSIGQRWLVDEVRRVLLALDVKVFSPVYEVGRGSAKDIAPKDISAIHECDAMFAIIDGIDSGTIFEIGYARALGKPVFGLAQSVPEEDLKMIVGSGCIVSADFASLLLQVAQRS